MFEGKLVSHKYTYRYKIAKMLLNASYPGSAAKKIINIKYNKLPRKTNTPLHWAIYWADYDLAHLIIHENPKLLFFVNEDNLVPFDMCENVIANVLELKSKIVVDMLLNDIFEVLNNTQDREIMTKFENYFKDKEHSNFLNRRNSLAHANTTGNFALNERIELKNADSDTDALQKLFLDYHKKRLKRNSKKQTSYNKDTDGPIKVF